MDDRELLSLAAKAAGLYVEYESVWRYQEGAQDFIEVKADKYGTRVKWNPLNDDGDALRLAVKLRMTVRSDDVVKRSVAAWDGDRCLEYWGDQDELQATRKAISRAAIIIGGAMP
jgi:hypothetical protein